MTYIKNPKSKNGYHFDYNHSEKVYVVYGHMGIFYKGKDRLEGIRKFNELAGN